jgi:hypothetical protein
VIDSANGVLLNTNEVFSPAFSIGVRPIIASRVGCAGPATITPRARLAVHRIGNIQ